MVLLGVRAPPQMLTARMKSRNPWEASELAPLAAAIVEAKGNGLRCVNPPINQ